MEDPGDDLLLTEPRASVPWWDRRKYRLNSNLKQAILLALVFTVAFTMGWLGSSAHNSGEGRSATGLVSQMASIILNNKPSVNHLLDTTPKPKQHQVSQILQQAADIASEWELPEYEGLPDGATVAVLAFSFGQGANHTPGATNEGLAWSINQALERYAAAGRAAAVVCAQWEVAEALQARYGRRADVVARPQGGYLDTFGVMQQFRGSLALRAITQVVVVAHPDHAVRCARVAEHFNYTVLGGWMEGIPWTQLGCDVLGYDPASAQPWTRERATYLLHELQVRPKMVAKEEIDFLPQRS